MKFVIQRVQHASVTVDNEVIGKIGKGFVVLIGVSEEDNTEIADKMIKKLIGMRIFEDENGKTNLSIKRTLPPPAKPQSSRLQNRSYGSAPRSSAPNDRSAAPRQTASAPAQPQQKSFDDMLKQFMSESDSKMSSIRAYSDHKTKTRRR